MLGNRRLDVDQLACDLIATDKLARLIRGLEAKQPVFGNASMQQLVDMPGMRADDDDAIRDF